MIPFWRWCASSVCGDQTSQRAREFVSFSLINTVDIIYKWKDLLDKKMAEGIVVHFHHVYISAESRLFSSTLFTVALQSPWGGQDDDVLFVVDVKLVPLHRGSWTKSSESFPTGYWTFNLYTFVAFCLVNLLIFKLEPERKEDLYKFVWDEWNKEKCCWACCLC